MSIEIIIHHVKISYNYQLLKILHHYKFQNLWQFLEFLVLTEREPRSGAALWRFIRQGAWKFHPFNFVPIKTIQNRWWIFNICVNIQSSYENIAKRIQQCIICYLHEPLHHIFQSLIKIDPNQYPQHEI